MTENFIKSSGANIWTISEGKGVPLLLCNGGPGCCDYLSPVADMVSDISNVLRFEQRGCGRSETIGPYNMETCIADIEAVREHYGIERWVVGGHSWGADLAIAYAVTYPERVLGIIGISGGAILKDREWHKQYRNLKDTVGEIEPKYEYPPNMDVNREVNASWSEFVRMPTLLRRIAELDIPALFVYGEKDIRPAWPVQQTANLLPKGHFVLIEDAPHVIWHSHEKKLREHLRNFVLKIQ